MIPLLFAAFLLGFASGLRTFTGPAVLLLSLRMWPAGIVVAIVAILEYVMDALPQCPSRLRPMGQVFRAISGAVVGYILARAMGGPQVASAVAGIIGAVAGTHLGYRFRMIAIARLTAIPAAIAEDILTLLIALFAVWKFA